MASINGIWGNTYSNTQSLFGSAYNVKNVNSGNILGIDFGEYASVSRGSYSKLVKAYYSKYGNTKEATSAIRSESKEETAAKTTLKTNANDLHKAAGELTSTGKNSLFQQVEKKDSETGVTTKDYDKDKIYKAVNRFVDSYNGLVKKAADSKDNAVLRQTLHMVNSAVSNRSMLADVGIKVNADNSLSIDEENFKGADMNKVKTLFNGKDSFAAKTEAAASNIYMNVNNSLGDGKTYTASGSFGNYNSGNILDSLL